MSTFMCDSCEVQIPPQNPRFHCQNCPNYDSCANCHALQETRGNHSRMHGSNLIRMSGLKGQVQQQQNMQYQQAQPVGPPYQQQAQPYQQQQAYATGNQNAWSPLYNPDNTPTQIFVIVIQQLFACLDPHRTGYITPEAYSSFLEAQGYPPQMNTWRHAYNSAFGNKESTADATLKSAYETFAMEHILQKRQIAAPPPQPQQRGGFLSSLLSGNMTNNFAAALSGPASPMPLLTLRGFIDGLALDVLVDPAAGWSYLNRALRYYQIPIWREKGDVPRPMIPMVTPPAIQLMISQMQQNALNRANTQLETARMNAEIQRRGNDIAVSAIGGSGQWVYRY